MHARSSSHDVVDNEQTPVTSKTVRLAPIPVETFDEYVVVGRLGTGGMAEVILALARGPNGFRKLVAIKRLHEHLCEDPDAVEMFMHEARLTAGLHHANVVQVHKVGVSDGRPFMAMEYLDGQPFNRVLTRMKARGAASLPATVVRLMLPVLAGLHYVHEAKDYDGAPLAIVHRDISPQNIFVTFDGQVKLLDFGIAKARSVSALTRTGLVKGKLGYIAPEQAAAQHVDRRADLWSVGVTLWEGLTGVRLFQGRADIAAAHAGQEVPWLSDVNAEVPLALADIVHKALRYDRNERYRSALEFSHALEAWLATQEQPLQAPLSSSLRALFFDTIGQRESTLRTCLASLDTNDALARAAEEHATAARDSQESVAARLSFATPPPRRRVAQRSAIACAVAFAVGLGVWQADDGDTVRAAHVRQAPVSALRPDAALQLQVAGAAPSRAAREPIAPLTGDAIMGAKATEPLPSIATVQPNKKTRREPVSPPSAEQPPPELSRAKPSRPKPLPAPELPAVEARGRLVLDSVPYAVVSLEGKRLGITPLEVDLPASKVTLDLRNPERGIVTSYQVRVVAGQTVSRRVSLE